MTIDSLTLLLPPLSPPEEGEWTPMPALQTLLSKGDRDALAGGFSDTLCAHFGVDGGLAPLSALGDGVAVEGGWWLRADPVHFVADRDQLFLSASDALGLSQVEADSLVAELNRTYADDGWHFIAATPQRWYLRLPEAVAIQTVPTVEAMGRRVGEVLPQGDDAMAWQRVMTEVQMLLHSSSVNLQRSAEGALAVNGIWFWGGGELPSSIKAPEFDSVQTDHPVARGLAKLAALPHGASNMPGRVLWVADTATDDVFDSLLQKLKSGELVELVIELPDQGRWHINKKALRRWWRRRKPLASLL